jgi:hypothetical protein
MDLLLCLAFWRKVHQYLGWVLVLLPIYWFASGLVMSVLPIKEVRGEHLRKSFVAQDWSQAICPAALAKQHSGHHLKLSQQGAIPLCQFSKDEEQLYYSALTGGSVVPLTETQVKDLVRLQYQGKAGIARIQQLQKAPFEVRDLTTPLWLVQFADEGDSSFYLEEYSGKLLSVRTNNWRLFDFVWMLHIMDYENRENFNHPLLAIFSASALFITLSEALLLPWRRKKRTHS